MLTGIIEDFARRMERRVAELTAEFTRTLDFAGLEAALNEECAKLNAELQQTMLQTLLLEEMFLSLIGRFLSNQLL